MNYLQKKRELLGCILQKIEQYLTETRSEPKIKQKCDRYGNLYWQIIEPNSGKSTMFGSEQDVKFWLAKNSQRYN
jgi:hypothetical protein